MQESASLKYSRQAQGPSRTVSITIRLDPLTCVARVYQPQILQMGHKCVTYGSYMRHIRIHIYEVTCMHTCTFVYYNSYRQAQGPARTVGRTLRLDPLTCHRGGNPVGLVV